MSKKPKNRIIFEYRRRFHKLLNFYWGKDASFYFTIYRRDDEKCERVEVTRLPDGILKIDGTKILKDQFPAAKISRHSSGVIHVQDAKGNREKDGIKSWSLAETGYKVILMVFPQTLDRLVEIKKPEPRDLVFHLADDQEEKPFSLQIAVHKYGSRTNLPPNLLGNGVITVEIDDIPSHELLIFSPFVKKSVPDSTFPPRTVYLIA